MAWCEENGVDYIFGIAGNRVLDVLAYEAADDLEVRHAEAGADKMRSVATFAYAAHSWNRERRAVARLEASRLLFLSCTDWDRRRVHARVREAAREFPEDHVPKGFACFPVRHVGEKSLQATQKHGELDVVSRIRRPTIGGRAVSGPCLFFGVAL